MDTDRDSAKKAITESSQSDPELTRALSDAHKLQLELEKERNRHNEAMRSADLGVSGRWFGGEKNAPTVIAGVAAAFGLIVYAGCLLDAAKMPESSEFWGKNAERILAFSAATLAFIFGRGTK